MHHSGRPVFCLVTFGLILILNSCGGGSSTPPPPPPPPISVSLSQTMATVEAGATADFTADVINDSSNMGVKWSVSCAAPQCGTVLPASTASGASTTYTAPAQPPGSDLAVTVIAASLADATKTASASVTVPTIVVSVSPGTATVQAGATAHLSATVANDPSNSGVTWNVSCSVANCGAVSPNASPSGAATTYTAPSPLPSGGIAISVTATSTTDTSKSSSVTLIPVGHIPGYNVGVDYHAFGASIDQTGFLAVYDQPQVRQMVQTQLQEMADRGASSIQTTVWVMKGPSFCCSNAGFTFPVTDQEATNLRTYAQDVASVASARGNGLRLFITLTWLHEADYTIGSPTTTLGSDNLTPAEYVTRVQATTDKVLAAVGDVTRPDGVKLVDTIFFELEANLPDSQTPPGPLTNRGWFIVTNYPYFVTGASKVGIRPAVYFSCVGDQDDVFDDTYVDALFPILNGHRSMFQVYRGVKFFLENGLPLPSGRLDFDCYMVSTGATYDQMLQRILDDADATMPSLGVPKIYDIPETYYLLDPSARLQYGQTFATQAAQNSRLQRVSFWTWPDGGGPGQDPTYPFTIEDFLAPPGP